MGSNPCATKVNDIRSITSEYDLENKGIVFKLSACVNLPLLRGTQLLKRSQTQEES